MADLYVVENSLVQAVANTLYTTGTYTPYAVVTSDILGLQMRLMRGWPVDNQLVADLKAGITNITVFSLPGARNTTRFLRQNMEQVTNIPDPTMTATASGNTITFAGTPSTNELIAVSYGNVAGYSYRLQATDTPTSVAAAFAANLPNASASGAVLTINRNDPISLAVYCDVTINTEVHRQEQTWKVSIWSPTTDARDQFSNAIDAALQYNDRLFLPDGSCTGPIVGAGTYVDDVPERENLWRRDLHYCIEYPTDYIQVVPVMVLGEVQDSEGRWTTYDA